MKNKNCRSLSPAGSEVLILAKLREISRRSEIGDLTSDQLQAIIDHRNPFNWPLSCEQIRWKTGVILQNTFGHEQQISEIPPLPKTVTEELYVKLGALNMSPFFFPNLDIDENFNRCNYVKPKPWFYKKISEGLISKTATKLDGQWVFMDCTPAMIRNKIYENDHLIPLIRQLRKDGKIERGNDSLNWIHDDSRYKIKRTEWSDVVAPAFAELIGVQSNQVRLLKAIESNFVANAYNKIFYMSDVFEFFVENFGDNSVADPNSGGWYLCGHPFNIEYTANNGSESMVAGRLLVEFPQ